MEEVKKRQILKRLYSDKEVISSPYYNLDEDKTIQIISDLHFDPQVDREQFDLLITYCQIIQPDYIVFPGDIVESFSVLENIDSRYYFEYFIRSLAEICPLVLTLGNHEIADFNLQNFFTQKHNECLQAVYYFETLNQINNVYFLYNQQIDLNNINFCGFCPSLSTYLEKNNVVEEKFIKEFIDNDFRINEDDYNILLTHSPYFLNRKNVQKEIKDLQNTDLIISGHYHGGYIPRFLQKDGKSSNFGFFFTPFIWPIPGTPCRGKHEFGRGHLYVSKGYRKFVTDIPLFHLLEKFSVKDSELLTLSNSNEKVKNKSLIF